MLKFANKLPDDYEYAIVYWGQSNARPWGTRSEGFSEATQLALEAPGTDLAGLSGIAGGSGDVVTTTTTLTADRWIGAETRLGVVATPTYGVGIVTDNTATTLTIDWSTAPDVAATEGWLIHREQLWKAYRTVRVLTPYTLEAPGTYSDPPIPYGVGAGAYTLPSTITKSEDWGLFLPFTFYEGIEGPGLTGTATGTGSTTPHLTTGSVFGANDLYDGAHISIPAEGIYGTIATHTATEITLDANGWIGGTPSATADFVIIIPHYLNNPHAITAGPGFRYPSNEPMPFPVSTATPALHNRAAGVTTYGYSNTSNNTLARFGAMLVHAWHVSRQIGKRVNVIYLGINSAGIYEQQAHNAFGCQQVVGWWDPDKMLDWTPARSDGAAARLKKMIETMAPAALTAEGNTKPLKIIGIFGSQGEADALDANTRDSYTAALPGFYSWLIDIIDGAGLSYYSDAKKMPICHQEIRASPYELAGDFELYAGGPIVTLTGDSDGLVNAAINNFAAKRQFTATLNVDDSPNLTADPLHFNGVGEAQNGKATASLIVSEIDSALSSEDDVDDSSVIAICHMALAYIGDIARITSLDTTVDTSAQASYCKKFYAKAREILLQQMAWSFATRRTPLEVVTDARDEEWAFAYGYPNNAVRVFAVLPPDAGDDVSSGVRGTAVVQDSTGALRTRSFGNYVPLPFTVEQDDDGHKIIYTNTENAVGRYNVVISDVRQYSPAFMNALAIKLASMLAGPIMRGESGVKMRIAMEQLLEVELGKAKEHDAVQHDLKPDHIPPTIRARW